MSDLRVGVELLHRGRNAAPHGVVDRVLLGRLVEDDPAVVNALTFSLELEGFDVCAYVDGEARWGLFSLMLVASIDAPALLSTRMRSPSWPRITGRLALGPK